MTRKSQILILAGLCLAVGAIGFRSMRKPVPQHPVPARPVQDVEPTKQGSFDTQPQAASESAASTSTPSDRVSPPPSTEAVVAPTGSHSEVNPTKQDTVETPSAALPEQVPAVSPQPAGMPHESVDTSSQAEPAKPVVAIDTPATLPENDATALLPFSGAPEPSQVTPPTPVVPKQKSNIVGEAEALDNASLRRSVSILKNHNRRLQDELSALKNECLQLRQALAAAQSNTHDSENTSKSSSDAALTGARRRTFTVNP